MRFWRERRPDIAFALELAFDDDALSDALREAAYRIVQEGLSNAVRHGQPQRIEIAVRLEAASELLVQVTDDGVGKASPELAAGFGLTGMRERIAAVGGALALRSSPGAGWTISARAPLSPAAAMAKAS